MSTSSPGRRRFWRSAAARGTLALLTTLLTLAGTSTVSGQPATTRQDNARIDLKTGTARAIYRPRFEKAGGAPDEVARTFLTSEKRIGWTGSPRSLRLVSTRRSPAGTHITYQQYIGDVPVIDAVTKVSLNGDAEPTFVMNGFEPGLPDEARLTPQITASFAEEAAAEAVEGGEATARPATLAILPGDPIRLVWKTTVWPETGGEWRVLVDAVTGEVVRVEDRTLHRSSRERIRKPGRLVGLLEPSVQTSSAAVQATGAGMVFDPDPLTTSGKEYAPPYTDGDDADTPELNAERISVELLNISQFADNKYRLAGPYVEVVGRRPFGVSNYEPPAEVDPAQFNYTRSDDRFEAVMVYYHIDTSQRWVQDMGFHDIQNMPLPVNPFGEGNVDNSNYYLDQNFLSFGSGGIDDAEDAFVIWHEYSHALLNANVPNFTSTFVGRSIHEGLADYWAASRQRELSESGKVPAGDWRHLFRWDGNNPPWTGRDMPEFARYPDDLTGSSPYSDGLVLASALMGIWDRLGRSMTDELNLQSHYYLTNSATMPDVAEAIIQADIDLYDGEHAPDIIGVFAERGFVDETSFGPTITHTPISDTEQLGGSIDIAAQVSGLVYRIQSVKLNYTIGDEQREIPLNSIGNKTYIGQIPLPFTPSIVEYYIVAVDEQGQEVRFPDDAPATVVRFQAGPDNEPPVIDHVPIVQLSLLGWPPQVSATITDNIGVDSAFVEYSIEDFISGSPIDAGRFMLAADGDRFKGSFPGLVGQLDGDEVVRYRIVSTDKASAGNRAALPPAEQPPFEFLIRAEGTIAYFDFEGGAGQTTATGAWELGAPSYGVTYAHSGTDAWATMLDGEYPDFTGEDELILPSLNLSGLSTAWLDFWHWYDMEHDGTAVPASEVDATLWDGGNVQVSTDGGSTWSVVTPEGGYDGTIATGSGNPIEGQEAFGGYSLGWRREVVEIPAGPDVRIKFVFGHDVSNSETSLSFAGWVIDDVMVRVDRPQDEEAPIVLEEPPAFSEEEAGTTAVLVSLRAEDNVGVASVEVVYELSGALQDNGTARLAQSSTDPELFSGVIPLSPGSAAPGSVLTYDITVADFDGNTVTAPEAGDYFRVEFAFVARNDQLLSLTPTGGWAEEGGSWLVSDATFAGGSAALVLSPIDLPSDAADLRFELLHEYHLEPPAKAAVVVTDDDGATWGLIEPTSGYPVADQGFQGEAAGVKSVFDLNEWAGRQIQLRLVFQTSESLAENDYWMVESASAVFRAEGDRFTIPRTLELNPNFPDPFTGTTTLSYTIPEPTVVTLSAYDVLGRCVATIVDEPMEPGTYTIQWDAASLAGGTYFLRLQTKSGQATEAVTVIR